MMGHGQNANERYVALLEAVRAVRQRMNLYDTWYVPTTEAANALDAILIEYGNVDREAIDERQQTRCKV